MSGLPACQPDHIGLSLVRSVHFTPTVQHCSMATLIGLSLRVKLMQTLPSRFKVCTSLTSASPCLAALQLTVCLYCALARSYELSGAGTECRAAATTCAL